MNSAILTAVHIANGHTPGNARVLAGYVYDDYVRAPVWYAKATRTTARGNKDPNAGNKDRDEERLARVVRVGLANQIERIWRALGDPPDIKRLDEEFWDTEEQAWLTILRPELERMALSSAETLHGAIPIGIDWALITRRSAQWARDYSFDLVRDIDQTGRDLLREKVAGYFETPGLTMGDLRESIAPGFGRARAETIAVTEVTRAYAQGEAQIADEAKGMGLVLTPTWQTNKDELVCALCGELDGKKAKEHPPKHPRCRCWESYEWEA